ncbi:sterol desaturase family protein [Reichenbachiella versicolor]|uniref:sterol desaturase family protein n=1 Tax=Reichenbachiella versicolor TaxID=1821036 RepID=UPI000D6E048B|nr:sterol desaturase family protein [Reichenbachiella versicolor]
MEQLIDFFTNIPTSFRATLLVGGLVIFWTVEGIIPLHRVKYKKWQHAWVNIFFTLASIVIGFGMAGLLLLTSDYVVENRIGLLYLIELPLWTQVVFSVLLMDLIGAYSIHWLEHKVKRLWQIHLIHHSDTNVDVTTGLRHHPFETFLRISFTILATMIIGAPIGMVMLYQSLSVLFTHLTHANVEIFGKLDKPLSYLFVTPNMHKVHHHYRLPLTDTNYGNIFSIWDRLFGTFAYVDDMKNIRYGIDTHMDSKEHSKISNLLAMPFQKYRSPQND